MTPTRQKAKALVEEAVKVAVESGDPRRFLTYLKKLLTVPGEPDEIVERFDPKTAQIVLIGKKRHPKPFPRDVINDEVEFDEQIIVSSHVRGLWFHFDNDLQEYLLDFIPEFVQPAYGNRLGVPKLLTLQIKSFKSDSKNEKWNRIVERFRRTNRNGFGSASKFDLNLFLVRNRNEKILKLMREHPVEKPVRVFGKTYLPGNYPDPDVLYYVIATPERFYSEPVAEQVRKLRTLIFETDIDSGSGERQEGLGGM